MRTSSRLLRVVCFLATLCATGAASSSAQIPRLVKDLNASGAGSGAFLQAEMGGFLYLRASEADHGDELWKTDGTAEGTRLVKDIRPGPKPSTSYYMARAGDTIFFAPESDEYGIELWKTDGTEAGTVLVKDTLPGPESGFPEYLVTVGDKLFFVARDEQAASELWTSDGTEAGTRMVKKISTKEGCCGAGPLRLTASGDKLFFRADDGVHGEELWVSDGTEAGTQLVKDIDPGKSGSTPDGLFDFEGTLYFSASDRDHGEELWKSDGTEAGTMLVKDIWPGPRSSFPRGLAAVGGSLFFAAEDRDHGAELWTSDGTEDGTLLVSDGRPGRRSGGAYGITDVGGTAFFFATTKEDEFSNPLWALWTSDGSEAGTRPVRAVEPGSLGYVNAEALEFDGELIFSGYDPIRGIELWKSDGTEAGTEPIKDIYPGEGGSEPLTLTRLGDRILFSAEDAAHGRELWSTDGTEAGTAMLRDINFKGTVDSSPEGVAELDGVLYFAAREPSSGRELWRSDGTATGTFLVRDIDPAGDGLGNNWNPDIVAAGGKLFFFADDGVHGKELWTSDGTRAGTRLVKDVFDNASGQDPFTLTATETDVYFGGFSGRKSEIWHSDGTEEGTRVIHRSGGYLDLLASLGGLVFFEYGGELWRSDSTSSGTFAIATVDFTGFRGGTSGEFVALGDVLLFAPGDDSSTGFDREIWRTDGTRAGTFIVKDIAPGPASSNPGRLIEHDGRIFFRADDGVHGVELWQTDGTAAGTTMVADLSPGRASSLLWPLGGIPGGLLFAAEVRISKGETRAGLWKTTGVPGETQFVSAEAQPFHEPAKALGSHVYFSNHHPSGLTYGTELWRSDGTRKGTELVADLNPGLRDSSPRDLTVAGRNLFFSATSGRYGRELWVVGAGPSNGFSGSLTSLPDLDGLGGEELATLFSNLVVRDAASGEVILRTPLGPKNGWQAIDLEPLPDLDGNDAAEVAVLARRRNRMRVFVRDALTAELLATVDLPRGREPLDLEILSGDDDGDVPASLAVLTRHGLGGRSWLTVRGLSDTDELDIPLASDFDALDLEVAPADGRGGSPVLVTLGQSGPSDRARLLSVHPVNGLVLADLTLAGGLVPLDLEIVQRGPKSPGLAAVLVETARGASRVLILDLETGKTLRTLRLGKKYRALDLEPQPGRKGAVGPAVSVLEARRSNGRVRVSTRDALSGRKMGTATFKDVLLPLDLATVRDLDGSDGFEAAVLGEAECAQGGAAIVLRDSENGSRLGCYPVP